MPPLSARCTNVSRLPLGPGRPELAKRRTAAPRYDGLALVKPQFEAGRDRVGSGGVVRDPDVRRAVLIEVGEAASALGASVVGFASSGLPGPKGNRETFVHLAEGERGGVADLEAAAREVEP